MVHRVPPALGSHASPLAVPSCTPLQARPLDAPPDPSPSPPPSRHGLSMQLKELEERALDSSRQD